jgi:hypothetical protein
MRLDVDTALRMGILGKVEVCLDGEIVKDCILADEETGEVVVYDLAALRTGMEEIPTRTLHGDVHILVEDSK